MHMANILERTKIRILHRMRYVSFSFWKNSTNKISPFLPKKHFFDFMKFVTYFTYYTVLFVTYYKHTALFNLFIRSIKLSTLQAQSKNFEISSSTISHFEKVY